MAAKPAAMRSLPSPSPLERLQALLASSDLVAARALCRQIVDSTSSEGERGGEGERFVATLTLGRIAYVEGRRGEARRLASALRRSARDAVSLVKIGELYRLLGAREEAASCWHQALRWHSSALLPHQKLYEHYKEEDDESRALEHLEAVLARFPHSQWGRREKAARLFHQGRWDEAFDLYQGLPLAFDAHSCGEIRLRQGRADEARKCYQAATTRSPEAPWPYYRLAVLEASEGRVTEALAWLDRAPAGAWGLEDLRARLLARAGDDPAVASLRAANLADPSLAPLFEARLRDIENGRCVLHSYLDRHDWGRIRLRVILYRHEAPGSTPPEDRGRSLDDELMQRSRTLLEHLASFHHREFGSSGRVEVASVETRWGARPYSWFEDSIAHEGMAAMCRELVVPRQRPGEMVMVLWWDPCSTEPLSRGYGGHGHGVVECVWTDAFLDSIATHEMYHATLGLPHTDGEKDALDAAGLMGWPGTQNRLGDTFLNFRQKACCATYPRARAHARRGRRAEKEGRWDEAARAYRSALEQDPLHLHVLMRLFLVETHRGRYDQALDLLERRSRLDPSAATSAARAQVLLDLGRKAEAKRVLSCARGYGSSERTHWVAGAAYARSWYMRDALAEFRRGRALCPASLHSHVHEAATLHIMGRFDEARRMYEAALESDPNWGDVWDNLAMLHARTGDLVSARRCLRRAGHLKGGEASHLFATVRVRCLEGNFKPVPSLLARALEDEPYTVMYLFWKAYAHLVEGQRRQALADWRLCAATERLSPWGLAARGWIALLDPSAGAPEWARHLRVVRRLDRRNSGVAPLVHLRSALEHRLGLAEASISQMRVQVLMPRHPWSREQFLALGNVPSGPSNTDM